MLRRFTVSLGLTAVLVAACGGADTSNPAALCTSYANAFCNKAKACGAPGVNSSCSSDIQTQLDCSHFSCPTGTTFDSGAAGQCIDQINGLSCTDAIDVVANSSLPSVCSRICH
jgi:hypothetical protein